MVGGPGSYWTLKHYICQIAHIEKVCYYTYLLYVGIGFSYDACDHIPYHFNSNDLKTQLCVGAILKLAPCWPPSGSLLASSLD